MARTFLQLSKVSFSFENTVPVLRDATIRLEAGKWAGIVGANGDGKTTLLRLINGDLLPDSGTILRPHGTIHLCPQSIDEIDEYVSDLEASQERSARSLRGQFSLQSPVERLWSQLSPGQRKQWQIAAALYREPVVLLLDEPTNHLDHEARNSFLTAIRRFKGIGLIVSHDRTVLNSITQITIRLRAGAATTYRAAYDEARLLWSQEEIQLKERLEVLEAERDRLHSSLSRQRQAQAKGEKKRHGSNRMKGRKDNDANSAAATHRAERGERRITQSISVTNTYLERLGEEISRIPIQRELGGPIFLEYEDSPKRTLLSLESKELKAGSRVLIRDVNLHVNRKDRIWLKGDNGAGKSTLLLALLQEAKVPDERLLFIPQEIGNQATQDLVRRVSILEPNQRARVLSIVATLGVDPEIVLHSTQLSPGQSRKLALAFGLGTLVWGLILDEPTNHLDLPSVENLRACLERYPGCFIIVTHDDYLLKGLANVIWSISDSEVKVTYPELSFNQNLLPKSS